MRKRCRVSVTRNSTPALESQPADSRDGTPLSVMGSLGAAAITFGIAMWVSLATALDTQDVFRFRDDPTAIFLRSDGLFTLTFVWPAL